mmetsp:Transcript_60070/g.178120  ORF Transcript_60070/g.178120 Transcript_60070/m.178120 type:complete len:101 (-) Transcript_60070:1050-1352(-)
MSSGSPSSHFVSTLFSTCFVNIIVLLVHQVTTTLFLLVPTPLVVLVVLSDIIRADSFSLIGGSSSNSGMKVICINSIYRSFLQNIYLSALRFNSVSCLDE